MGSYEPAPDTRDDRLEQLVRWTSKAGMPDVHALLMELQRRRAAVAASQERVRTVVREAFLSIESMAGHPYTDAIATRVAEQLAGAAPAAPIDPSSTRTAAARLTSVAKQAKKLIDGDPGIEEKLVTRSLAAAVLDAHRLLVDYPEGAAIAAIVHRLHLSSERAPDVRAEPMRLVRQDVFDELLLATRGAKP